MNNDASESSTLLNECFKISIEDIERIDWREVATLSLGVLDPIGQLKDWIASALTGFIDIIRKAFETVAAPIADYASRIWSVIQGIPGTLANILNAVNTVVVKPILDALNWVSTQFPSIVNAVGMLISRVGDFISGIPDAFRNIVSRFTSMVSDIFNGLISTVRGGFSWLLDQLSKLPDMFRDVSSRIASLFGDLAERVKSGFSWFIEQVGKLPDIIKTLIDKAEALFAELIDRASKGFSGLLDLLGKAASMVKDALATIIGDIVRGVGGIVEYIRGGFNTVIEWFSRARDWFTEATNALKVLGANFMGFVNAVLQLPERLQYVFGSVVEFFKGLWQALQEFTKDPISWFKKNIVEPAWTGIVGIVGKTVETLKPVWDAIVSAVQFAWDKFMEFAGKVRDAVFEKLHAFAEAVMSSITAKIDALRKAGEAIYGKFMEGFTAMVNAVEGAGKGLGEALITPLWKDLAWTGPPILTAENMVKAWIVSFKLSIPLFTFGLAMELPIRAVAFIARGIAMSMRDLEWKVKIDFAPLGLGGETEFDVAKAVGGALYNFSEELMKHSDKFYEPFWMGVGFWYGRYAGMLLTYYLRNFIPIEIPALTEFEDAYLRARVSVKVPKELGRGGEDIINGMMGLLKVRGFSDYLLKWTFAEPDEYHMKVKDRFEIERTIPLGMVWRIPSPSDIVTMMIRDVIVDPEQFEKIMNVAGYYRDVSSMYYLLHYRYPPPERLAEFYWRGITGVLWYTETLEEKPIKDFLKVKYDARKPVELNYDAETLNDMMMRYMKWHDYAPFPWSKDYPTDKSIIVELMAELPDKVDMRWMMRWGIYEHLSKLNVGMDTSIPNIIEAAKKATGKETVVEKVTKEISLDVRMLARMLESRGMHPYFASLVAVADAHVALTDEMTFLRGGFIELFREGLLTLDATEKLMSGLFAVKFTTGYIDHTSGKPVTFDYMKPIFWLPAERRLLQLRAVMDRGYEIWRDIIRETASGVRRLALTVEGARKILEDYGKSIVEAISSQVEALTGVKWTPELDKKYVELWLKYGEALREVEVKTWIRHYITRVMAWITYRASYGWVKVEDYKGIVDEFVGRGWLVDEEGEFFKTLIDKVIGMVKREKIPTALTLATMAEYMVIDEKTIEKVFDEQRVMEDYRPLYKKYIEVKPFKSDYKTLLNRARRALVLGAIAEDEWSKYKEDALKNYGFRDVEIAIQEALAELDMKIENAGEYVPTPSTLATMAEILPEVRNYISQVLSVRRVKGVWVEFWTKYIWLRPVYDNVSKWATAMFNLTEYFIIDIKQLDEVFKILKTYGWEDLEVTIAQKTILAEQVRYAFSSVIGTPRELAYMARYTDKATDLAYTRASMMINALPIDDQTKNFLKQMWREYITNAQADSEIDMYRTEVINSYAYGILDDKGLDQELDNLRKLGVPEMRLSLIKRIAQLRRVRYSYQYWY